MAYYYFTTTETMRYILEGGNIFATHVGYLNDSEEYINGLRELRPILKTFSDEIDETFFEKESVQLPDIFSISFSKAADLSSQWSMYAKESGVRMTFNFPRNRYISAKIKNKEDENNFRQDKIRLKPVYYYTKIGMDAKTYEKETEKIQKEIGEILKDREINDVSGNILSILRDEAPYIKNFEFRQEEESRLVFHSQKKDLIEYRCAKGVLIPYLDIIKEDGWPITEIMIGPGRNKERVFRSICHYLEQNGTTIRIGRINKESQVKEYFKDLARYQISKVQIDGYQARVQDAVRNTRDIVTYQEAIREQLGRQGDLERRYLERNYFSECGIIVRQSNAPFEF